MSVPTSPISAFMTHLWPGCPPRGTYRGWRSPDGGPRTGVPASAAEGCRTRRCHFDGDERNVHNVRQGHLGERQGSFELQQFGSMHAGSQALRYEVVPGSGSGQLAGIVGTLHLDIDDDGTHHYELEYDL